MKLKYYFISLFVSAMAVAMVSCNDDEPELPVIDPADLPQTSDIVSGTDMVKVKIGDSPVALQLTGGAGEYFGISLNPEIATVTNNGGQILVSAVSNGLTAVVVTDADSKSVTVPVQAYTTDVLQLDINTINAEYLMGKVNTFKVNVVLGNGDYAIKTDGNANVSATINSETGEASISARATDDKYTSVVTISDCTGITATVTLNITGNDNPFDDNTLETIKGLTPFSVSLNDRSLYYYNYGSSAAQKTANGYQLGKVYYSSYGIRVSFDGDASVGKKTNGTLFVNDYFYDNFERISLNLSADVEVIKVTDTAIYVIFKAVNSSGTMYYGYVVDNLPS